MFTPGRAESDIGGGDTPTTLLVPSLISIVPFTVISGVLYSFCVAWIRLDHLNKA